MPGKSADHCRPTAQTWLARTGGHWGARPVALVLALLGGCGERLGRSALVATAPMAGELLPVSRDHQFKSARFSPDGTLIAFHALVGSDRDIVGFMRPDGSDPQELASTQSPLSSVAWSPDGKTLYFTSSRGIEQVDPVSKVASLVTAAFDATDLDVSADGAQLLWVKDGSTLQSLQRNQPGATPRDETHRGTHPRFDENGATPGYVYVGLSGAAHPLQRDILGTTGPSGGVTLDLGPLASVSVLGKDHYVVSSTAGIERLSQDGTRSVIREGSGMSRVDATADGHWILYLMTDKPSLFVMGSP